MAERFQISCIIKDDKLNPYERILFVGGSGAAGRWKISQKQAISDIETGAKSFFVKVNNVEADVIVSTSRFGNKYIKTKADGDEPNNLLSLPQCL